jgi:DNA-binding MltR family transcriptional regulator
MVDEDAKQYLRDMTDIAMEFRGSLSDETDRGCALMAAEYISNQLGELLRAYFVDDEKACNSALDDPNGSLSALSARIEFAYLLGLIGPIARPELDLIRKIRNDFAHAYKPLLFTETKIADRCRELRAYTVFPEQSPRANFVRSVMGLLGGHSREPAVSHTCEPIQGHSN